MAYILQKSIRKVFIEYVGNRILQKLNENTTDSKWNPDQLLIELKQIFGKMAAVAKKEMLIIC